VKLLEDLRIAELSSEQIEELCRAAEEAARNHVLSKVHSERIERLNIRMEAENSKPVRLAVDVNVALSPLMKTFDVQELVNEALKGAFTSAERSLRELKCHSQK
jgi:hypothetical protein